MDVPIIDKKPVVAVRNSNEGIIRLRKTAADPDNGRELSLGSKTFSVRFFFTTAGVPAAS